jgi:hypothetical protein
VRSFENKLYPSWHLQEPTLIDLLPLMLRKRNTLFLKATKFAAKPITWLAKEHISKKRCKQIKLTPNLTKNILAYYHHMNRDLEKIVCKDLKTLGY